MPHFPRPVWFVTLTLSALASCSCGPSRGTQPVAVVADRSAAPEKSVEHSRAGPKTPVTIGGVTVLVGDVEVMPTDGIGLDGRPQECLSISVGITTADKNKLATYHPWQGGVGQPTLRDNLGNVYPAFPRPLFMPGVQAVRADRPAADVLVFDTPLPAAKFVDLDLPAENVGATGTFRFRLPLVKPPAPPGTKPTAGKLKK